MIKTIYYILLNISHVLGKVMVDLHKVETYDATLWHVRLWLYIVNKTTFGNWFSSRSRHSWYAEDDVFECIPKGFCAYWWGLILYFVLQVPITIASLSIVAIALFYAPLMCIALWFSGVDVFLFANISGDLILNIGVAMLNAMLILYCIAIFTIGILCIIKKFTDVHIVDNIKEGVSRLEMVKTCNKLYEAHKQKYCPMITINKTKDKDD